MDLEFYPERAEFRELAEKGNLIPVCLEVLADTETPVSALAKIYDGQDRSSCWKAWKAVRGGAGTASLAIRPPGCSESSGMKSKL